LPYSGVRLLYVSLFRFLFFCKRMNSRQVERIVFYPLLKNESVVKNALNEHRAFLKSLEKGDVRETRSLLKKHIENGMLNVIDQVRFTSPLGDELGRLREEGHSRRRGRRLADVMQNYRPRQRRMCACRAETASR
jgi:hypothetical protein